MIGVETVIPILGAASGTGGIMLWAFKVWFSRLNKRLDKHEETLHKIELLLAENKGKQELVWREINTDKIKIVKIESKIDKAWETISRIASPRISDMLSKEVDT